MPARTRTIENDVSQVTAKRLRERRDELGLTRADLSLKLARHYCNRHPRGCVMSAQVITHIEMGKSRGAVRLVTVDEAVALAHVLDSNVKELRGEV